MIVVIVRDKRFRYNRRLEFFEGKRVTREVIDFVKKHKNAYLISFEDRNYTRSIFIEKFCK